MIDVELGTGRKSLYGLMEDCCYCLTVPLFKAHGRDICVNIEMERIKAKALLIGTNCLLITT